MHVPHAFLSLHSYMHKIMTNHIPTELANERGVELYCPYTVSYSQIDSSSRPSTSHCWPSASEVLLINDLLRDVPRLRILEQGSPWGPREARRRRAIIWSKARGGAWRKEESGRLAACRRERCGWVAAGSWRRAGPHGWCAAVEACGGLTHARADLRQECRRTSTSAAELRQGCLRRSGPRGSGRACK